MSVARRTVDAVVAAVLEGKDLPVELFELQNYLVDLEREEGVIWDAGNTPDFVYSYLPDPDWDDYCVDRLTDNLDEARLEALRAGAEPTAEEIEMWSNAYIEVFLEDPDWFGGYEYRTVKDSRDRKVVVVLEKTGGGWDYDESIFGVYQTREEAYKAIEEEGRGILEAF